MVAPVAGRPITPTSAPLPGWRRQAAWAAAGLVAIGVVYLVQRETEGPRGSHAAIVADGSPMPLVERPKVDAATIPVHLETLPSPARETVAEVAEPAAALGTAAQSKVTEGSAPPASTQAPTPARPKSGPRATTTAANLEQSSQPSPSPNPSPNDIAAGRSKAVAPSKAAEAPQQVARASVPQSAAPMDDAQVLAGALEKCSKENFLAGIICEQKAYLQYCDGKWDQVPKCTKKAGGD
jgi:hypothetical protein